ncbi:MAG: 4Fe-4S dicluster domain-containing protein [Caldithrix sp.]|nr:4Fe-4S dicluster domain-containing protein [Caldithrix sp.]
MISIEIDGREVKAEPGETILTALNREGVHVPTLCHMEGLLPSGACRICSVEVEGQDSLTPSCSYPVQDGMKIQTNSPKAVKARKTIIELLLANHPNDCLYCVRNGNCQLQDLAELYGIRERRYLAEPCKHKMDVSSPSIIRDQDKCILCGKCVRICEEIMGVSAIDFVKRGSQSVIAPAFEEGMNVSGCINCGQCVLACPTGALREKSHLKEVMDALQDPQRFVVVQHAPAISVTLAEEFGVKPGKDVEGAMISALRRLGFDRVFDTAFSADLTIIEEATELVQRIKQNERLPLLTSCSPGWIKFVEQTYPDFTQNLSTCKSPQQMLGAVLKHYYTQKEDIDINNVYSVAIMPCTAKKYEAQRPELSSHGIADVDAVLTTRELARLIRMYGIQFEGLPAGQPNIPFGRRSSAGKMFAVTGGVMEAALRTAHQMITGENSPEPEFKQVRGLKGIREAHIEIDGMTLGIAVANGIQNAQILLDQIRKGRDDLHFIEVMTCPGGCIAGGGQPFDTQPQNIHARLQALYDIDRRETVRTSHENKAVQQLYDEFLQQPLSKKSHELLHTTYSKRNVLL